MADRDKKAYLLVYADHLGDRDAVKATLNAMDEVLTWRYDMPNCFYFVSEKSAKELSNEIARRMGEHRGFIVSEITANFFGRLTPPTWTFIREKKAQGSD